MFGRLESLRRQIDGACRTIAVLRSRSLPDATEASLLRLMQDDFEYLQELLASTDQDSPRQMSVLESACRASMNRFLHVYLNIDAAAMRELKASLRSASAGDSVTPSPGPSPPHTMRLFDSDGERVRAMSFYIAQALDGGAAALVVARDDNWAAVVQTLASRFGSITSHVSSGQLTFVDADEALESIVRDDWPDEGRFATTIATPVAKQSQRGRLFVYGEMVDQLAGRGLHRAAHRLEQLWNDLAHRHSFELFCGYSSVHFASTASDRMLKAICEEHSEVHAHAHDPFGSSIVARARES